MAWVIPSDFSPRITFIPVLEFGPIGTGHFLVTSIFVPNDLACTVRSYIDSP